MGIREDADDGQDHNEDDRQYSRLVQALSRAQVLPHRARSQTPQNDRENHSNQQDTTSDPLDGGNCATKWTDLPPECTYGMLFDSIRGVGAVSHATLTSSPAPGGSSVARVEFFERESVVRLMTKQFRVGSREPYVQLDGPRSVTESNQVPLEHGNGGRGTRVIQVIGDPRIVQEGTLKNLLCERYMLARGLEGISTTVRDGLNYVELRFTSYALEAKLAREFFLGQQYSFSLPESQRLLWRQVKCVYIQDPCE